MRGVSLAIALGASVTVAAGCGGEQTAAAGVGVGNHIYKDTIGKKFDAEQSHPFMIA